ncbi:hypothetical protein Scep_029308 [Stephania cephalantha]|uniref:Uncharacterized protein n=1 Tax=Stephania cephalantha TaxID=152367 RepID=A0AAP0E105_9MAGN
MVRQSRAWLLLLGVDLGSMKREEQRSGSCRCCGHNEGDEDVKMRSNLCKGILVNVHVQPYLILTLKLPTKQDTQMGLNYLNPCVSPITN